MKIAHVCSNYGSASSGITVFVQNLCEDLAKQGISVDVLSDDISLPDNYQRYDLNGVNIRKFKAHTLARGIVYSGSLASYLKININNYDLVHVHLYYSQHAIFTHIYKPQKLVVQTYYHNQSLTSFTSIVRLPYNLMGSILLKKDDAVICISEFEKAALIKSLKLKGANIIILPCGIDLDQIHTAIPFDEGLGHILYVGRLEKYKNIHIILRVLRLLPSKYNLIIIGNGPFKNSLIRLISKYKIDHRVKIFSGLETQDVYRWYKSCCLTINLSSAESFGLTVIESLAAGTPVLVNSETALGDFVGKLTGVNGIKISEVSDIKIANSIIDTINMEPDSYELQEYDRRKVASRYKTLYLEIIEGDQAT